MVVCNGDSRPVECAVVAVDAARKVDVLGIHEETFVKQSRGPQSILAQKHEAPLMIGYVPGHGVVEMFQQILLAHGLEKPLGEKPPYEDVGG